jgi:putative glutamine amidotransferase
MAMRPRPHMPRPLIGLTTSELRMPETFRPRAQGDPAERELALGLTYPVAVERGGAIPVVIPPLGADAIESLLDGLDGLILTGGPDLHPGAYGAQPHPQLGPTVQDIDVFELALTKAAEARGLPILAICRGMQALNVARGGTLIQDLPTEHRGGLGHRQVEPGSIATHPVRVRKGSMLARLAGGTELDVNSFHHQAIDVLGDGLRAVAWAPDGVIEAVEDPRAEFLVGVQWHLESLVAGHAEQAALLAAFIAAAGDRGAAHARAEAVA